MHLVGLMAKEVKSSGANGSPVHEGLKDIVEQAEGVCKKYHRLPFPQPVIIGSIGRNAQILA